MEPIHIVADGPVLVGQYAHGTNDDGADGDPFLLRVPPVTAHLFETRVSTPDSLVNLLNIIAPTWAADSVFLDGSPLAGFTPIGASGLSGLQVGVASGEHVVSSEARIGVHAYGFSGPSGSGYGYPVSSGASPAGTTTARPTMAIIG